MKLETPATLQPITYQGMLEIMFIGLKLSHIIAWSWWWVLSPSWITFILLLFVVSGKKVTE